MEFKGSNWRLAMKIARPMAYFKYSAKTKIITLLQNAWDLSSGENFSLSEKDGAILAKWILAHTRTNGKGMRKIISNIMEEV